MKTFKQTLNESKIEITDSLPEDVTRLITHAKSEFKQGYPAVRGINRSTLEGRAELIAKVDTGEKEDDILPIRFHIYKLAIRKDRRSLSMDDDDSALFDDWFYKNFYMRARSQAMFGVMGLDSESLDVAKNYGIPAVVVPVGVFDYLWSPEYDDLFFASVKFNDKAEDRVKEADRFLKAGNYQYNKGLKEVPKGTEVMFDCDEYIAIVPYVGSTPSPYLPDHIMKRWANLIWE